MYYTPIYLKTPLPDAKKLLDFMAIKSKVHSTKLWNYWTVRYKPYQSYDDRWEKRYTNDNISAIWDEDFLSNFPECIDFLNTLPFKEITHINLLEQIKDVPLHKDYHKNESTYKDQMCYKWLLIPGELNSFFIERTDNSILFVNPPPSYNCFVIPESKIRHGAIKKNKEKIIASIFGILDNERHSNLVKISMEKFNEHLVSE